MKEFLALFLVGVIVNAVTGRMGLVILAQLLILILIKSYG